MTRFTYFNKAAVILTALEVETRAVLRQLGNVTVETVSGTGFFNGRFEGWNISVAEVGAGNQRAAAIAVRAFEHYGPNVALFVGVAGGLKDTQIGDVVVATRIYGYESGREQASGLRPRPDVMNAAHDLEQRARVLRQREDWRGRLDPTIGHGHSDIFIGPIAAGEKVVASKRSATAKLIAEHYGDALAVEMEGRGFLEAVHINHPVRGCVVRGISDLLSGKAHADKAGSQRRAADAASAVAFEILSVLGADTERLPLLAQVGAPNGDQVSRSSIGAPELARLLNLAQELTRVATGPALQSRVDAFFEEYLRAETGPMPFGGREQELADLDRWLDDEPGPARCLISGPAGRGKSALLVRWIERLQRCGRLASGSGSRSSGWNPVFVPISIRFGTNAQEAFYHALADRLAALAGQSLGQPITDAARFYADKVRDLLVELGRSGRPILLIVDGLDEALRGDFDATIIPRVLPSTIRVLMSARCLVGDIGSRGWLDRLGWREGAGAATIDLNVLDQTEITDVLVGMGAPVDIVAFDRALVARLHELTGGEPLLVRYYAADLWQIGEGVTRISRADIDRLKPGFGAYFDRWLELQEKSWREAGENVSLADIDATLMALSFAYGPLESRDLVAVISHLPFGRPHPVLHRLLAPLRRFVIGDGNHQGYVLSHSKIGEYLREERFPEAARVAQGAFLRWGRSLVAESNRTPSKAASTPRYLVQFYRRHLQDGSVEVADFLALVENGWRGAWESYEGSQEGFSADVRAVWDAVRSQGPLENLGAQLRCILTLTSVRSLGHNVPHELIVAAVARKVLSVRQARHLARFMRNHNDYVAILSLLASEFESEPAMKQELLAEALAAAKVIGRENARADALSALAGHLSGDQMDDALAAATAIDDEKARAHVLTALAGHFSGERRRETIGKALAAAKAIDNEMVRADGLSALAGHLSEEQLGEALATAKAIGSEFWRGRALSALAGHLSGEQPGEALAAAKAIGDERSRAYVLEALAGLLSEEQLSEALAAAKAIGDNYSRACALSALACHLSGDQHDEVVGEALAAAAAIDNEITRADMLIRLSDHLNDEQLGGVLAAAKAIHSEEFSRARVLEALAGRLGEEQLGEARAVAKAIAHEWSRAFALRELASRLCGEQRQEMMVEALAAARSVVDKHGRAFSLEALAHHFSGDQRNEVVEEALRAAKAIEGEEQRANALRALAVHLSEEQMGVALAAAKAIDSEISRADALKALADHLSDEQLGEALAAAKAIRDERSRARALKALAGRLSEEQLGEALGAVKAIAYECERGSALSGLAVHLNEEQLGEALAAAKAIGDEEMRASALTAIASRLSKGLRDEVVGQALAAAKAIGNEDARASALRALAGHMSREQMSDALAVARAIGEDEARAYALTALAAHVSWQQRREVERDATAAERAFHDKRQHYYRVHAMATFFAQQQGTTVHPVEPIFSKWSPDSELNELAGQLSFAQSGGTLAAAKALSNEPPLHARASALSDLAGQLSGEERRESLSLFLRDGDCLTRPEFLSLVKLFAPAIAELGGEGALLDLARAIRDTAEWFP